MMKIAVCLIVRNEARDISEWLAYYAASGVDAFLVYDNASTDGTPEVLEAAAKLLDVRLTPWPSPAGRAQLQAYQHAIATYGHEFDWIAFLDSDEFLVTHGRHTLRSICEGARNAAAIGVNWAMFGSNGHIRMPDNLVIEAFTRRSLREFDANRHVKSIVRPKAVADCANPHAFHLHGRAYSPAGAPLIWKTEGRIAHVGLSSVSPEYSVAQINHYFTRSREHWARKVARGYPNASSREKLAHFDHYDRNDIEDCCALGKVGALQQIRSAILDQHRRRAAVASNQYPSYQTANGGSQARWS